MYEESMDMVACQLLNVQYQLEQLILLTEEVQNEALREKIDEQIIKAMQYLDKIF